MDTLRRQLADHHRDDTASPSPEMFSFPGTPTEADGESSSEFEFGSCIMTPDDSSDHPMNVSHHDHLNKNTASPADQFFLNGRLLPHDFPVVASTTSSRTSFSGRENAGLRDHNNNNNNNNNNVNNVVNLSRGTSVGSNMSKDSLMSSRSNSANSRGSVVSGGAGSTCSTCSSARTSSCDVSERRAFQKRMRASGSVRDHNQQRNVSPLGQYQYSEFGRTTSRRWQFITPAPVLGPSRSRRARRETGVGPIASPGNNTNKKKRDNNNEGFLQKVLRTFVARCKACHAMEGQENEFDMDGTGTTVMA